MKVGRISPEIPDFIINHMNRHQKVITGFAGRSMMAWISTNSVARIPKDVLVIEKMMCFMYFAWSGIIRSVIMGEIDQPTGVLPYMVFYSIWNRGLL